MARSALVALLVLLLNLFPSAHAAVPEIGQPTWVQLTQEQQQILAPLAQDWDQMEGYRRKKWLGIAKHYPAMKPDEQARVQQNIKTWASLTPEQRRKARDRYKNLQKAPPEQRAVIKQKWEEYKDLPQEEKKRLAQQPARRLPPKTQLPPKPLPPKPGAVLPAAPGSTLSGKVHSYHSFI